MCVCTTKYKYISSVQYNFHSKSFKWNVCTCKNLYIMQIGKKNNNNERNSLFIWIFIYKMTSKLPCYVRSIEQNFLLRSTTITNDFSSEINVTDKACHDIIGHVCSCFSYLCLFICFCFKSWINYKMSLSYTCCLIILLLIHFTL